MRQPEERTRCLLLRLPALPSCLLPGPPLWVRGTIVANGESPPSLTYCTVSKRTGGRARAMRTPLGKGAVRCQRGLPGHLLDFTTNQLPSLGELKLGGDPEFPSSRPQLPGTLKTAGARLEAPGSFSWGAFWASGRKECTSLQNYSPTPSVPWVLSPPKSLTGHERVGLEWPDRSRARGGWMRNRARGPGASLWSRGSPRAAPPSLQASRRSPEEGRDKVAEATLFFFFFFFVVGAEVLEVPIGR